MESIEVLKSEGWNFSETGWQKLTENGVTSKDAIEKKALDIDFRELGGCCFPPELAKTNLLSGNYVVQVQKIRNISAPKANEESKAAPRLLKFTLTDGTQVCHGVEMTPIPSVSTNTVPGTKLRLKGDIIISHGHLQLHAANIEILGGRVASMFEKWIFNKSVAKHSRGRVGVEGGPPPWIPFGQKIAPLNISIKNFKSLDDGSKENKDDEFEAQRRDAIAEAGKSSVKKVFGGGNKPLLDKNVQAIMEQGFTLQQAEAALRQAKNNVKKALKTLQRRTGNKNGESKDGKPEGKEGVKGGRRKNEEELAPKPSGKVSLFQFLEDKLPTQHEKEKEKEKEKEWESMPPTTGGVVIEKPKPYMGGSMGRPSGREGGGYGKGPGGGGNVNHRTGGGAERRNKEERRPNISQNIQKAPRFQNQNRHTDYNSMQFGQYNKNDNALTNHHEPPPPMENYMPRKNEGFNRPSNKFDSYGYSSSNGDYRNPSSSYYKPHGMPEIPEFPYKDSSFIPPLMSTSISYFQSTKPTKNPEKWRWEIGDKCMAKYWEDNIYYNAEITGLSNKTCVVRFLEYGNYEEVLHDDCIPLSEDTNKNTHLNPQEYDHPTNYNNNPGRSNHFSDALSGVIEFRRGGTRPYIKSESASGNPRKGGQQPRYSQGVYVAPGARREPK